MRQRLAIAALLAPLAACTTLADRFERGSQALSTGDGAAYFVRIGPILQDALNICIPSSLKPPSPTIMVLADIDAVGAASDVVIEPESEGTRCIEDELGRARFPAPPLAAGATTFPLGIRIDLQPPRL